MSGDTHAIAAHAIAVERQWKLARLARKRYRIVRGKMRTRNAKKPRHDMAATVATAVEIEQQRRAVQDAALIAKAQPGQYIPGHGVFIARFTFTDKESGLSEEFNAFAARGDLADENGKSAFTFVEALEALSRVKDLEGHDGTYFYATAEELASAIKDGRYKGGWVVPPSELLSGTDADDKEVQPDNLLALKDTRDFKGTFNTTAGDKSTRPDSYWSCTKTPVNYSIRKAATFSSDEEFWYFKNGVVMSCRPVRLERVATP